MGRWRFTIEGDQAVQFAVSVMPDDTTLGWASNVTPDHFPDGTVITFENLEVQ